MERLFCLHVKHIKYWSCWLDTMERTLSLSIEYVWYIHVYHLLMLIIGENDHYLQHRRGWTWICISWHHPCHCPIGCNRVKRFPRIMVTSLLHMYNDSILLLIIHLAASSSRLKYPAMARIQSGYWIQIFYHHALMLLKNPTLSMTGTWYVYSHDWNDPF